MIFSDEEDGNKISDTTEIEFISSISKETSKKAVVPEESKKKLVIPLKESINDTAEKLTTISFEAENNHQTEQTKMSKKTTWGLQVPARKKPISGHTSSVPILLRNRVIGMDECKSESEKLTKDLNSRPDEPSRDSYNKIPVEEFGAAMLRGMGWTGSDSTSSSSGVIKYVPRPERLGLGASEVADVSELKQRRPVEQSLGIEMSKEEEKKLNLSSNNNKRKPMEIPRANVVGIDEVAPKRLKINVEIGSRVIITDGPHSGLKGYVKGEGGKDPSKFWLIELEINGRDTLIPKTQARLYDSRVKEKKESEINVSDSHSRLDDDVLWTCSGLKVKIKSKSFENGKYYNRKGIIIDVHPDRTCSLKLLDTSSSTIIQRVPQRALETCLPRDIDPTRPTVKYLKRDKGEEKFQAPFRVLQFDDEKGRAVIQAEDDFQFIFEAHYDDICEFI